MRICTSLIKNLYQKDIKKVGLVILSGSRELWICVGGKIIIRPLAWLEGNGADHLRETHRSPRRCARRDINGDSSEVALEKHLEIQNGVQEMEIGSGICVFPGSLCVCAPKFLLRLVTSVPRKRTLQLPWMRDMGSSKVYSLLFGGDDGRRRRS